MIWRAMLALEARLEVAAASGGDGTQTQLMELARQQLRAEGKDEMAAEHALHELFSDEDSLGKLVKLLQPAAVSKQHCEQRGWPFTAFERCEAEDGRRCVMRCDDTRRWSGRHVGRVRCHAPES